MADPLDRIESDSGECHTNCDKVPTTPANNTPMQNPEIDSSKFKFLSDVFRIRALDPIQRPLLAFPRAITNNGKYEQLGTFDEYTAVELDRMVDKAAWWYHGLDIFETDARTVAILGPTNLDWIVSLFALSRIGYTIVTLSPRLSSQAITKLMAETECKTLIFWPSPQLLPVVDQTKSAMPCAQSFSMFETGNFNDGAISRFEKKGKFERKAVEMMAERQRPALILHSSGSTGLPKPIYLAHDKFRVPFDIGPGDRDFITLPLYHAFAARTAPSRMFERKTVYFPNPNLPLTSDNLTMTIREAKPMTLCAVPYVLKLLAEQESGVEALKSCKQVMFTGSQCPDELGDFLVQRGVNLASFIGSTECSFIGASLNRPPVDKAWNYIRPPPPLMKHIWPKPISKEAFEFVFLQGHPGRLISNSDDPPESFHSSDLFTPHHTIPNAWKYLGRLDDRVTLTNGEKVLPLPIEGRVKQDALVKEAVVFGVGRSVPGLLLFRAEAAKELSDEAFVSSIWPIIESTNRAAEGFSQIVRDMIVPLPAGIEIPTTDKGNIIRAQVYKLFEREIEHSYSLLDDRCEGTMDLNLDELRQYLLKQGQSIIGPQLSDLQDDLFAHGLNSLQAIQLRGCILRDLNLFGKGRSLGQNIVFEQGNLSNLAEYIYNLRLSRQSHNVDPVAAMRELISKYSVRESALGYPPSRDRCSHSFYSFNSDKHVVVLTGATGGLGARILRGLSEEPRVERIYCLVRGNNPWARLSDSLREQHLFIKDISKIVALSSDLCQAHLGLEDVEYNDLLARTSHIIHCAWPVNFQLALNAFEPSLRGLRNLLRLSLDVKSPRPAQLLFCSSISVALGTPGPARISEAPIQNFEYASLTGYAQSKLVGERIIQAAVQEVGADATILRIGQVIGDTHSGIWKDSEAIPLMVRSAVTMGVLPELNMTCEWLPVNTVAESIIQIAGLDGSHGPNEKLEKHLVYNIVSPKSFSWTSDLLPALSSAGIRYRPTSFETWLHQLRNLSISLSSQLSGVVTTETDKEPIPALPPAADPNQNPAIKLVDFFEQTFQNNTDRPSTEIKFETREAQRVAPALREAPSVIESGLVAKILGVWMAKWQIAEG